MLPHTSNTVFNEHSQNYFPRGYLPSERNCINNERQTDNNSLYEASVLMLIAPNNGGKIHEALPIYL